MKQQTIIKTSIINPASLRLFSMHANFHRRGFNFALASRRHSQLLLRSAQITHIEIFFRRGMRPAFGIASLPSNRSSVESPRD